MYHARREHPRPRGCIKAAKLIELLRLKPTDVQTKTIDMLMSSKIAKLEVYDLELRSVNHQFSLSVKATKEQDRVVVY